ncbi:MAG: phosphoribosylformylglycinamidine synthase subunit PurQ [Rhodobacteraceae bacterium]|nr:phosphoribosylformylglycinamidine synthase subunit PurQ [Paracoccaceae bacterium]
MKTAVIVFPGSNCDRDLAVAFEGMSGQKPHMVWHKDVSLPAGLDVIGIPGGFSFGDYLRCGAIAARSPICRAVVDFAHRGGHVLGICNGFQILTETGLLPGALMRNRDLKYICKDIDLAVKTTNSPFTNAYRKDQRITIPIAHHDGNYNADQKVLAALKAEDRIAFEYCDNPNGSAENIAGILSENRRVLGMMPHPERLNDVELGGMDGRGLFVSLAKALIHA